MIRFFVVSIFFLLFGVSFQTHAITEHLVITGETVMDNSFGKYIDLTCPSGFVRSHAGWEAIHKLGWNIHAEQVASLPNGPQQWQIQAQLPKSLFAPKWKLKGYLVCISSHHSYPTTWKAVQAPRIVEPGPHVQSTLKCPSNFLSLGVGNSLVTPDRYLVQNIEHHSLPNYDGKSWLVNLLNLSTTSPVMSWSIGSCINPAVDIAAGYSIQFRDSAITNEEMMSQKVTCPQGEVLAAGWGVLDTTNVIEAGKMTYSRPLPSSEGSGWEIAAYYASVPFQPWKLRVAVLCGELDLR